MFFVDALADFIIDCNLIFPIAHVHKHAVVIATLRLTHEVLAVLHCSEQYLYSLSQMVKRLHLYYSTRKASAACSGVSKVTYAVIFL